MPTVAIDIGGTFTPVLGQLQGGHDGDRLETKKAIGRELLEQGILQHTGGKRYISTEHGDEEFDRTQKAFVEAVERVDGR